MIMVVLNVHAPNKHKSGDANDSFCEELEHKFNQFPQYHMKILLGNLNAKYGHKIFSNYQE
jgi:hypothetical protein